jgi:hypothetical protein
LQVVPKEIQVNEKEQMLALFLLEIVEKTHATQ